MKEKELIKQILKKYAEAQTNLAASSAREMIADEIIKTIFQNKNKFSNSGHDIRQSSWPNGF